MGNLACVYAKPVSPRGLWELGLAELFFRHEVDLNGAAFHIPKTLLTMVGAIGIGDPEYSHDKAYYDTLRYLGSLYAGLLRDEPGPRMSLRVMTWLTFVPDQFIELGRQYRPRALVILAYYSMFLTTVRDIWWIQGIGDCAIRDILKYLTDDAWSANLALRRSALSLDCGLNVAKLLLDDLNWEPPASYASDNTHTRQSTSSDNYDYP